MAATLNNLSDNFFIDKYYLSILLPFSPTDLSSLVPTLPPVYTLSRKRPKTWGDVGSYRQVRLTGEQINIKKICIHSLHPTASRLTLWSESDPGPYWCAASILPLWNGHCNIELIFGIMLQFNVVRWYIFPLRNNASASNQMMASKVMKLAGKNTIVQK